MKLLMTTGSLEWNLLQRVSHRPGEVVTVDFLITNLTGAARAYQIFMALFDMASGGVIAGTTGPISIDGVDAFEVPGDSQTEVTACLKVDYSDVYLQAALYDVESGEMAVGLQTILEPPPGTTEQMVPVISFASGVMMLGMVAKSITGVMAGMGG